MSKKLIILFLTFVLVNNANADTIDFWHVYYNKTKIKEYNQYSNGTIVLNLKQIKKTDSLTIYYFRDTPCIDCETTVAVEDKKRRLITKGKSRGTFNPIKISIYGLLKYYLKGDKEIHEVYYQEGDRKRVLIFNLRLE